MGDRIRRMNAKEVEKILKKYGFELVSQKGSHKKSRNLERNLQVTVPYHQGISIIKEKIYLLERSEIF
nr:type II toxin-antitoxin system HicA family toxin [Myxosarcina sp. GI1]